jgi:heavy metal translocating P-type ATPase
MDKLRTGLLILALIGLGAGLVLQFSGAPELAKLLWSLTVLPVLAALTWEIITELARGAVGLDIVAALSMTAALLTGETLAAVVVAVMYSGGTFLESYAEGRARREIRELLARVPRTATRLIDHHLDEIPVESVAVGDRLLIRQGDIVPVDGTIASDNAFLDASALTGEALPVRLHDGDEAMSGSTNAGDAFELVALRPAAASTYAGIVRLVETAQRSKAPMSRLADRWSLGFLALTLAIAGAAWLFTGDPVRGVAVLVVATPCPLILAVPVALVAGVSRAAHFGVLVKGAGPLEAMADARTLVLDKTGTLTEGRAQIVSIERQGELTEAALLSLAASLDQASKHPVAQAIVAAAKDRDVPLTIPQNVVESPGEGVSGTVDGHHVVVGGHRFVASQLNLTDLEYPPIATGSVSVSIAVDQQLAGHLIMSDPLRHDASAVIAGLRKSGIGRIILATGDREDVAREITAGLDLDAVRAQLTPDQKVLVVLSERKHGPVMMVGDGVNDAPALAAADVGVAMGARGAAASAEAADVVLLVDQLGRLASGLDIARRTRKIALESVMAGLGLSIAAMIAAAFGYLTPLQGAVLQEAIDVAVILNALRVLAITPPSLGPLPAGSSLR